MYDNHLSIVYNGTLFQKIVKNIYFSVSFANFRDDHVLLRWNIVTNESVKICQLPNDIYPIDFDSFSRIQGSGKKHGQDQLLITSTDG